jgi:tripartite-type tricarboxylate transporter receptor subunit TctC
MMSTLKSFLLALACTLACAAAVRAENPSDYPSGPVKIIVPFAPGGATDVVTRIFIDLLSARWGGRPIVIENRPGAGTVIGANVIAKAPPDGYTIGMVVGSFMTNAAVSQNLPYDSAKDFSPLGMVAMQPMALVANKNFPAATVPELIEIARKSPDGLQFTSPGPRSSGHLTGEQLALRTGVKLQHISYSGGAPALTDVIANRVPLLFDVWHSAKRYVVTGDLKLIAGIGAQRLPDAPDVPTLAETYPGFDVVASQSIFGPAGMPKPLVDKLAADIRAVALSPEFADKTKNLGIEPKAMTPDELGSWVQSEIARWRGIAQAANIKVE